MAPAFSPRRSGAWREIGERLEWLLPPDQLREAQQATPNAFYTPPDLANACWQILRGFGFERGRILEPGCGAGAFISTTPADVDATWVGVERDPITARVAQLLHPSAQIINERLQNAALPAHSVDAVIGNAIQDEYPDRIELHFVATQELDFDSDGVVDEARGATIDLVAVDENSNGAFESANVTIHASDVRDANHNGVLDSFALPEMVTALEHEFGIKVPDSDLTPRRFESIASIGRYIQSRG